MERKWLDVPLCLESGQVFRWQVLPDNSWLGADGDYWFRIHDVEPSNPLSQLSVESNATLEQFRWLFRLDWDAQKIQDEILDRGPEMEPYLSSFPGLRVMRTYCSVEKFFSFLCTPNNHLSRIKPMVRHLATYGEILTTVEGVTVHRFPGIETIASILESDLRLHGFGYRAATIPHAAAQLLERGPGWLTDLANGPYLEAHKALCEIKGIGPKLADCICLFALDHSEAVPIDTHIWQAVTRLYHPDWLDKPLTDTRYLAASHHFRTRFGALSGWAQQYLFYENMTRRKQEIRAKLPVSHLTD